MNLTYYIYHIPGVKIGVTTNLKHRIEQKQKCTNYTVLETHTDIYKVSQRELELQAQYGYTVDSRPYWKMCQIQSQGRNLDWNQIHSNRQIDYKVKADNTKKPILQYTLDGELLKRWPGIKDAMQSLNVWSINMCLKGRQKTAGGYLWKYE